MKSWKKKWLEELDNITPELSDEVKNAPIPLASGETVISTGDVAIKTRNNRMWIMVAISVLLCLAVIGTILLIPKSNAVLYTVEINPAVSFVTDKKGRVTDVIAVNSDADVILSVKEARNNIIGQNIDTAIEYYVDCAAKLGYLDLNEIGSAVRISACADKNTDNTLTKISETLELYFENQGSFAVVVEDIVDIKEFCARSNIENSKSISDVAKKIRESNPIFANRNVSEATTEQQLQTTYESLIDNVLKFDFVSELRDNIPLISQNAEDINGLYEQNRQIENHEDNSGIFFKDYWSVKSKSNSESLTALIEQMTLKLDAYSAKYGTSIDSATQLNLAATCYELLPLETLQQLLDTFATSILDIYSEALSVIMEISGIIDSKIAQLVRLPQTFDEYVSKTAEILQMTYENRIAEYKEQYERVREQISVTDYQNYVDGLISEFGSLNAYWLATKK